MNPSRRTEGPDPLAILRAEILRWNRQINLVSRVRTHERLEMLLRQCEVGWDLVATTLAGEEWLAAASYVDLGSGAGLPGLVWAVARARLGHHGPSALVEPRDKRAWFLRRTARELGLERVSVWPVRWGAGMEGTEGMEGIAEGDALVSLKALRLSDEEVLGGFGAPGAAGTHPRRIAIVRFLDPVRSARAALDEDFAAADAGDGLGWRRGGLEILGEGNPRLLLSRYSSP